MLYATSILLTLMLIMSATAHLLAVKPAALVGFPVMIIGATSLLLVLLFLVGPQQQAEFGDPIMAAVENALIPAVAIDAQTGRILAANKQAVDFAGLQRVSPGNHFADLLSDGSPDECRRILRNTLDYGEFETQACSVRTSSNHAALAHIITRLHEMERMPFIVAGIATNEVSDAVAEFARVQERLMSNISHELRTPLNVVMGFSELLTTGTLGEMPDNQLDAAEECHEGGERMLRLINDILDVGRSRSYYLEAETRPLSPPGIIRRVHNLLSGQARREDIRMELDLDESLPVIESEERAFKQLVYHLMLNGMSRSTPGDTVRVSARRDGDNLVLAVADSGGEIAQDMQPRPVPATSEEEAAATLAPPLLGLPLCATLAERLGATLSTQVDEKTVQFIVRMPLLRF
ncbi:MAG: sensor histidine kinase [Armatimonadota bacterium]